MNECDCGHLLAAGAYGGWWCPVHKDMTPAPYAVQAVRELSEKYLEAANRLYVLERAPDAKTTPPEAQPETRKPYITEAMVRKAADATWKGKLTPGLVYLFAGRLNALLAEAQPEAAPAPQAALSEPPLTFDQWILEQGPRGLFSDTSREPRINVAHFAWDAALSAAPAEGVRMLTDEEIHHAINASWRFEDKPFPVCRATEAAFLRVNAGFRQMNDTVALPAAQPLTDEICQLAEKFSMLHSLFTDPMQEAHPQPEHVEARKGISAPWLVEAQKLADRVKRAIASPAACCEGKGTCTHNCTWGRGFAAGRAVQVDAPLPPMPDPKYIYHASPLDGEDDLFEFSESGAVDEGCEHCERLYTGEQVREIVLADRRQRAAEQPEPKNG